MSNSTQTAVTADDLSEVRLSHLQRLEAEAIQIMREAASEADNPAMLYSIGKDSTVMLHLARKAFFPSVPPFPLVHVDTMWKFQEMYRFRDATAKELGMDLVVHYNPECVERDINPFDHGSATPHRHVEDRRAQAVARREEVRPLLRRRSSRRGEVPCQGARLLDPLRTAPVGPQASAARTLAAVQLRVAARVRSIRVFPLSNWTELDLWQYIYLENIPLVSLYLAAERPVVERDGSLIVIDDDRFRFEPGEEPHMRTVRFRTLGCYPITGAIESDAATVPDIIRELFLATTSERQNRVADHDGISSLEQKKQEGHF